jgi:hypothetical protein
VAAADVRAVPCAVPDRALNLVSPDDFGYSDAFAVNLPPGDGRTAEAWARAIFTPHGRAQHGFARVWRAVMGVKPSRTGKRVGLFGLVTPERASAVLVGDGARYRIRLVVLADEGCLTLATFVRSRRTIWRQLLKPILVGHRRVAPRLLELAVRRRSAQP